ncbi:MAG TPA: SRPBCC family protein [Micromonosporaceae bacterium]
MSESEEKGGGVLQSVLSSPVVGRLTDQAKNYAVAKGEQVVGQLARKLLPGNTGEGADGGGPLGAAVGKGLEQLKDGKSPGRAAVGAAMTGMKEKVKSAFKRGGGGGGQLKVTNIEEQIDVGLPVDVVYNQWTQYPEFAKFMKGVENVDATSETESNWRVKVFLSRRSWKATTLEQVPDRKIKWTSEGAKGTTKGVVSFHPLADDLTRVILVMEYYPAGFFEKTGNLWRAGGRRTRLDLKHFRRFVSMSGEATGEWRGEIRDAEVVKQPEEATGRAEQQPEQAQPQEGEQAQAQGEQPQGEEQPQPAQGGQEPKAEQAQGEQQPEGEKTQGEQQAQGEKPKGEKPEGEQQPQGEQRQPEMASQES